MSEYIETVSTEDANAVIDGKLRKVFDGRIVRKDLTKKIKEGANVPVYVLEFLLGQYCCAPVQCLLRQLGVGLSSGALVLNTVPSM